MTINNKNQELLGWIAAGAVARGRDHKRDGTPSQDRCFRMVRNGCVATALCDGAGSRPFSHLAAARLSKEACHYLSGHFDMLYSLSPVQARRKIFNALYRSLRRFARRKQLSFDQMACTLLATVVKDDTFIAVHLGDGAIVRITKRGPVSLTAPSNGTFANETYFFNNKANLRRMRIIGGTLSDMTHGFILMSDGSASSLVSSDGKKVSPACQNITALVSRMPSCRSSRALRGLAHEILRKNTFDDCSLMVLCRTTPLSPDPVSPARQKSLPADSVRCAENPEAIAASAPTPSSAPAKKQVTRTRLYASGHRQRTATPNAYVPKSAAQAADCARNAADAFDYSTADLKSVSLPVRGTQPDKMRLPRQEKDAYRLATRNGKLPQRHVRMSHVQAHRELEKTPVQYIQRPSFVFVLC